jgi:hypothetical protein
MEGEIHMDFQKLLNGVATRHQSRSCVPAVYLHVLHLLFVDWFGRLCPHSRSANAALMLMALNRCDVYALVRFRDSARS